MVEKFKTVFGMGTALLMVLLGADLAALGWLVWLLLGWVALRLFGGSNGPYWSVLHQSAYGRVLCDNKIKSGQ